MIIKLIMLILATASSVLFIVFLIKGKPYTVMVDNLNEYEYFLKDFYTVGFAMNNTGLFRLRGKLEKELLNNAKLICDNIYYEYYAYLAWAQFLSLSLLTLCFGFMICSFVNGIATLFFFGITLICILAIWNISVVKMKDAITKRRDEYILEFPNMVSKLSLLINSGMVLREAWIFIANGKMGPLYDLMKKACDCMENGDSEIAAIHKFGVLSDSIEIKKFTSAMVQGMEKGNSELVDFLTSQTSELWAHKRQLALQKGEVAAGKLIIPLAIMFAGIILIVISAALQSMSF